LIGRNHKTTTAATPGKCLGNKRMRQRRKGINQSSEVGGDLGNKKTRSTSTKGDRNAKREKNIGGCWVLIRREREKKKLSLSSGR